MKAKTTVKTWEKTPRQNLARHKSGRYYARLYLNGKEIWKSLKTSHYSVAEARLANKVKGYRISLTAQDLPSSTRCTCR